MKIRVFLAMAAALTSALCLTSCVNQLKDDPESPVDGKQMTVTLSLPGEDGTATRASFEEKVVDGAFKGLKAKWDLGDEISVGPLNGPYEVFKQTGELADEGKTATFTGAVNSAWQDGTTFILLYPKLPEGEIIKDLTAQDGTLANLPKHDELQMQANYTGGTLDFSGFTVKRYVSFLRLPKGFALCRASYSGNVGLEISGETVVSKCKWDLTEIPATGSNTIKVGPLAVSEGKLTSDAYVAFWYSGNETCVMNFTVTPESGSWSKHYQLGYAFKEGKVYNIRDVSKLTDMDPPLTLEASLDETTITVKNPLGLVISYTKGGGAPVTSTAGDKSDIVISGLSAGEKIQFYGNNPTYCDSEDYTNITSDKDCFIYGNIMSLIASDGYDDATALSETDTYTFSYLFLKAPVKNHTEIELKLPATTLSPYCYSGMFRETKLSKAPALPASELKSHCYWGMFAQCSQLTAAPELSAKTLAEGCYFQMFAGCFSLEKAPALPATKMEDGCYNQMFYYCTSLTEAPALDAETLALSCYLGMFMNCSNLKTAPALPAKNLETSCYRQMFQKCSNLESAPELPAETLTTSCYKSMFDGCGKLNAVTCLATNISAVDCLTEWLRDVSATGTFTKASGMTGWESGSSGIPTGWSIANI